MWQLGFARLVKAKNRMKVNTLHTGTALDKHRNKYYYLNYFVYFKNRTQLGQVSRGTIPIPKDMSSSDHQLGFPWLVHRSTPWLYVSLFITNCPAQPVGILNFLRLFVWVIWFMVLTNPKGSGKTLPLHAYEGAQSFFLMTFSALIIQNIEQSSGLSTLVKFYYCPINNDCGLSEPSEATFAYSKQLC